jgi:hypothetical protein
LKGKTGAEGGRRQPERDRGTDDEMMGNESKYHRRDAKIYSIESRTVDEFSDCSVLEGGEAIRQKG